MRHGDAPFGALDTVRTEGKQTAFRSPDNQRSGNEL
jgi:hypothetical protein